MGMLSLDRGVGLCRIGWIAGACNSHLCLSGCVRGGVRGGLEFSSYGIHIPHKTKDTYRSSLYDERYGYGFQDMEKDFVWVGDESDVIDIQVTFFAKTFESPKDTNEFLVAIEH
jgi:hypothetical protein